MRLPTSQQVTQNGWKRKAQKVAASEVSLARVEGGHIDSSDGLTTP
jgi:hypothetical protein